MRSLGGSIGLTIAVIIFNSRIRSSTALKEALLPEQMAALFKSPLAIESFSLPQQALVSGVYAEAFAQQMRVATYISAVGFVLSLFTFEGNPLRKSSPSVGAADGDGDEELVVEEKEGGAPAVRVADGEKSVSQIKEDSAGQHV